MGWTAKEEKKKGIYWDLPNGRVVKTPPSNAGFTGSVPGWGTKILHAVQCGKNKKKMYVDYSSAVLRGEYWLCNLIVSDKFILSDVSNGADVLIREAQHTV